MQVSCVFLYVFVHSSVCVCLYVYVARADCNHRTLQKHPCRPPYCVSLPLQPMYQSPFWFSLVINAQRSACSFIQVVEQGQTSLIMLSYSNQGSEVEMMRCVQHKETHRHIPACVKQAAVAITSPYKNACEQWQQMQHIHAYATAFNLMISCQH